MADLQSCYFCGAPDDLGEYAVVPSRFGGGDRSVVLCPDCKTKLLRAIEPLIERVEAGDGGSGPSGDAEAEASGDPSPGQSGGAATDEPSGGITMSPGDDGERPDANTADGGETPPSYRRAMRMLSNRPFPIERTEAESMLANAYDLEREEIDAVLKRAAADGRLVVENGQLREP